MLPEQVKEVAARIGQFYLDKNKGDYKVTENEITDLCIASIDMANSEVTIVTGRPGLLIGSRGKNIEALEKYLNMRIKIVEDVDPLWAYLIPQREYY